jgi:hypothetical protein
MEFSFVFLFVIWYGVGVATGCTRWVRFPPETRFFSSPQRPHTDSCPEGTGGSFPGLKRPVSEADLSPQSVAEVKKDGAILPFPMPSWNSA